MGRVQWACGLACGSLLAFGTPAAAQTPARPPEAAAAKPLEVFTSMRDGTKLAANVFLPEGRGPWPVVLTRTPYLKDGRMFAPAGAKKWTDAGYAFVVQDVRGKGRSTGFYDAFANDIEDGYDSVEGLAKESWSNGKVGITGRLGHGHHVQPGRRRPAAAPEGGLCDRRPQRDLPHQLPRRRAGGQGPRRLAEGAGRAGGHDQAAAGQRGAQRVRRPRRAGRRRQVHQHSRLERRRLVRHLQHRLCGELRAPAARRRAGGQGQPAPDHGTLRPRRPFRRPRLSGAGTGWAP